MIDAIKKFFNPFKLPRDYKDLVYRVATGEKDYTSLAIRAHRKFLQTPEYKETPEYGFMHEIDTPCPDLMQRIRYRKLLMSINKQTRAI